MRVRVQIRTEHGGEILYDQIIDWENTQQRRSLNATLRDTFEAEMHVEMWRVYGEQK